MTNNTNIVKTFSFHGFNRSNIILNAKSHILIELVSYLTYNKFNKKKIVFLTDSVGIIIFKDIFNLDYDYELIDESTIFPNDLFCLPKIYSYKKFKNNFVHLDCDIIFNREVDFSFHGDLMYLHDENSVYKEYKNQIKNVFLPGKIYLPKVMEDNLYHMNIFNTGLLAVSKNTNLSYYYDETIKMYRDMRKVCENSYQFYHYSFGWLCAIPEQYFLGSCALHQKLNCKSFAVMHKNEKILSHMHTNKRDKDNDINMRQILMQLDNKRYLTYLDLISK